MKKIFLTVLFFVIALISNAQIDKILGEWCSVDDKTGEVTGVILFYQDDNGLYYGKTTHVYEKGKELFDPQYIGMILVKDFRLEDGQLVGGTLYEPHEDKTYYGKISYNAKDNTLSVRGSLDKRGWLGRTQTWIKNMKNE
ncbi:MAG: DUF2147 domain-containing protein [Bacteroidales bacterium]|nr:DUF2147 domain-containing protein [Bacteroidales bacterium]